MFFLQNLIASAKVYVNASNINKSTRHMHLNTLKCKYELELEKMWNCDVLFLVRTYLRSSSSTVVNTRIHNEHRDVFE